MRSKRKSWFSTTWPADVPRPVPLVVREATTIVNVVRGGKVVAHGASTAPVTVARLWWMERAGSGAKHVSRGHGAAG